MSIKDVTEEDAKLIRTIWKSTSRTDFVVLLGNGRFPRTLELWRQYPKKDNPRQLWRAAIDEILGTHGVEYLGWHRRAHEHVYYCNAGDTYATTIIFIGGNLTVGCWGDLVERNLIKARSD